MASEIPVVSPGVKGAGQDQILTIKATNNPLPLEAQTGGKPLEIFIRSKDLRATFGPLDPTDWEMEIRQHQPSASRT
jgi:hypothetical protein